MFFLRKKAIMSAPRPSHFSAVSAGLCEQNRCEVSSIILRVWRCSGSCPLDNCSDAEMKAWILGVDVNMYTLDYVFGAYLSRLILGHSGNLSKSLQNHNLSAVDGRCTANATVETPKSIRNDETWWVFWEKLLAHDNGLEVNKPSLPRQRSQPRSIQDYFGYGKGKEAVCICPKDH